MSGAKARKFTIRIILVGFLLWAVVSFAWILAYPKAKRPETTLDWITLAPGVLYSCDELVSKQAIRRVMVLKIDLREPGVRVVHRPFEYRNGFAGFTLSPADVQIRCHPRAIAILNSVRYHIDDFRDNFPGSFVLPLESVVAAGNISHRHEHSYLSWWTETGQLYQEYEKPPPNPLPAGMEYGIGLQGIQVINKLPRYNMMDAYGLETPYPRSFVGMSPSSHTIWLMAFESVTGREMIDYAVLLGVEIGGMVDSGDATNMLLGTGQRAVPAFTGIRNIRPIAGYLMVFYDGQP